MSTPAQSRPTSAERWLARLALAAVAGAGVVWHSGPATSGSPADVYRGAAG